MTSYLTTKLVFIVPSLSVSLLLAGCGSQSSQSGILEQNTLDSRTLMAANYEFKGRKDNLDCSLRLNLSNGRITSFEAHGVGTSKAIDIFGHCEGGGIYPCRQKGLLKSGLLGLPFENENEFASVNWEDTSFFATGFELKGQDKSSDSTRRVELRFDGTSYSYRETLSIDGFGLIIAAEQKMSCVDMSLTDQGN